jgi:hypothetical protein
MGRLTVLPTTGIFELVTPTGEIALAPLPRRQLCEDVLPGLYERLEVRPASQG